MGLEVKITPKRLTMTLDSSLRRGARTDCDQLHERDSRRALIGA